jgi:hypothetical protein
MYPYWMYTWADLKLIQNPDTSQYSLQELNAHLTCDSYLTFNYMQTGVQTYLKLTMLCYD